jgi:serine O-acetyltransferase
MKFVNIDRYQLAEYVRKQLSNLLPLPADAEVELIEVHMDEALRRLNRCVSQVRMWTPEQFDVLHSSQYCTFLYYLANTIWRRERAHKICTQLFLLNKSLNAIDCFFEVELPEVFFIGHSVGIVLAKATYGNHLVLYQNSTVGKNHGVAPVLEDGVILYPNTAVIGKCLVRRRSVIAQGVSVINRSTEANTIVFQGEGGELICKTHADTILGDFFRDCS